MRTGFACLFCLACALLPAQQEEQPGNIHVRRQQYFQELRAYPLDSIPAGARVRALQVVEQMRAAKGKAAAADRWTLVGPQPTTYSFIPNYITSGRVTALVVDPRDANVVFLAGAAGGVWKTKDGGQNWVPLTDNQASLSMGSLALDPLNPDIVYAGTGEENFAFDNYDGAGILKSTDGGATWTNLAGPAPNARIGHLAVHPADTRILLAAISAANSRPSSDAGIYRSADGGVTWTKVLSGVPGTSALFDPANGNIAYAALGSTAGNARNGVYKSTDGGVTWNSASGTGTSALPAANVGRIELALAPSSHLTLYAGMQDASTDTFGSSLGIFRSDDGAATWSATRAPDYCNPQCWYDNVIMIHPRDPNLVFAGGAAAPHVLLRSRDGGVTWADVSSGVNLVSLHVDHHALAFSADGSKLYAGNDGGVWSTTDVSSQAINWINLNATLAITQFYTGHAVDPTNVNIGYSGTQDNGTQRYTGNLAWESVTCGDGGSAVFDGAVTANIYASCQDIDVRRSGSNGDLGSWIPMSYGIDQNDRHRFIVPFAGDPSNPLRLYLGTFRVYQTTDGAGLWTPISPDLTGGTPRTVSAIGVAPSNPSTVFAGTLDGKVQMTDNAAAGAGARWTDRSAGLPGRSVTHFGFDPVDSNTVYVTLSGVSGISDNQGHVFKSTNGGASWTDISGNLPNIAMSDIVVDPDLAGTLYVGTDVGAFRSGDGGASWSVLASGLPNVPVTGLTLHRPARVLRAVTHGRSAWDLAVPIPGVPAGPTLISLAPATVNAGAGDLSLIVNGTNFTSRSVVRWNGLDRATKLVSGTLLTASIPAADLAVPGRASLLVFNSGAGGGLSNLLNFTIGPAPSLNAGGTVSVANPAGGGALAPGSIASVYGRNLASGTAAAAGRPPLPYSLGDVRASIRSVAAPLFFVSPSQVNLQIPWTVSGQAPLTLSLGVLSSNALTVPLTTYAPGLFSANQEGSGQGAVLISGTGSVAARVGAFPNSRPAGHGEFLEVYATGLGPVNNRPATGAASPSKPLATTTTTPTVTIGGVAATVNFSGLAPGYVGLYQVNVQVPASAPVGDAIPVLLTIGGAASNSITVAVQ